MSLFVRVFNNFYSHRKTARLKSQLGNDALWIPPRLWAYASENQPDGNFSGYTASEIAMLIGYLGDANVMLQALLQAQFLDPDMKIHDWADHNSYHATYKERATKAAHARWNSKQDRTGELQDRTGQEASIATSIDKQCFKHGDFPSTLEEAVTHAGLMNLPKDFVIDTWNKAASRGGCDAKDVPVRSFSHYLSTEWKYERARLHKTKMAKQGPNI